MAPTSKLTESLLENKDRHHAENLPKNWVASFMYLYSMSVPLVYKTPAP
jgi:hypothetical protein